MGGSHREIKMREWLKFSFIFPDYHSDALCYVINYATNFKMGKVQLNLHQLNP
jgi:hypothetical protein